MERERAYVAMRPSGKRRDDVGDVLLPVPGDGAEFGLYCSRCVR